MGKIWNEQDVYSREMGLDQKIAYTANNAIYVGRAFPGKAITDAAWQIYKMEYDGDGNMTSLRWADKTDDFTKVWNDRTGYNYLDI